jgi:hypothetical protein
VSIFTGKHVSISQFRQQAEEKGIVNVGRTTMHKIMKHDLKFRFKKPKVNEKYKVQPNVQKKRLKYLQDYYRYREQNRVFVWLDETWLFANGFKYKMWTDDTAEGIGTHKISDGKRYTLSCMLELKMGSFVKQVLCSHQKQTLGIFISSNLYIIITIH